MFPTLLWALQWLIDIRNAEKSERRTPTKDIVLWLSMTSLAEVNTETHFHAGTHFIVDYFHHPTEAETDEEEEEEDEVLDEEAQLMACMGLPLAFASSSDHKRTVS